MIYTHNCLTNMNTGFLDNLTVKFLFDLNFVQWLDDDQQAKKGMKLTEGGN